MATNMKSATLWKVSGESFRREKMWYIGKDPMVDNYGFRKGYDLRGNLQELIDNGEIPSGSNQGIIAIQNPDFFVQFYFHKGTYTRRVKHSEKKNGNSSTEALHSFIIGNGIGVDKVAEKLIKCLEWPLHAWGQDSTIILYVGPHPINDIADRMGGYIFSPYENKSRFFRPDTNYELKQKEVPLNISAVNSR